MLSLRFSLPRESEIIGISCLKPGTEPPFGFSSASSFFLFFFLGFGFFSFPALSGPDGLGSRKTGRAPMAAVRLAPSSP